MSVTGGEAAAGAPISVLHITQPVAAGVAAYVADACRDQLARGWRVSVACPSEGWLAQRLQRDRVPRLEWEARRSPAAGLHTEVPAIRRLVSVVRPDLLHLHSSKAGLAGRLAVRGRLPTLFQPHGWSWLAMPAAAAGAAVMWERLASRWTSALVCVGEGEAQLARAHGVPGRLEVVRNGADLSRFRAARPADRAAARARLGLDPRPPLAVCVGRLSRQKGQDVLLRAWPAVRQRCPHAQLVLVGDGDPAAQPGQAPGAWWAGPADDVWLWYAAADVVVLPSRWEGAPLTLVEAMAVGRSVVASEIRGIREVLPAGAGALVPPVATEPLAAAVAARLRQPGLADREGAVAARHAANRFNARAAYDALAAISMAVARQPATLR